MTITGHRWLPGPSPHGVRSPFVPHGIEGVGFAEAFVSVAVHVEDGAGGLVAEG